MIMVALSMQYMLRFQLSFDHIEFDTYAISACMGGYCNWAEL